MSNPFGNPLGGGNRGGSSGSFPVPSPMTQGGAQPPRPATATSMPKTPPRIASKVSTAAPAAMPQPPRSTSLTLTQLQMTGGGGAGGPSQFADIDEAEIKRQLWRLHAGELPGISHDNAIATQLEGLVGPLLQRAVHLTLRWNTSEKQPTQALIDQVRSGQGIRELPRGGVGVRASLFGANSDERDQFLTAIDSLNKSLRAPNAAGSAGGGGSAGGLSATQRTNASSVATSIPTFIWYYAQGEFIYDPTRLPREVVQAAVRSPKVVFPVLAYLRALYEWRDRRRAVFVKLRVVPSPRCERTPYAALGQQMLNQLVVLTGTVVRIGTSTSVCTRMCFECTTCGTRRTMTVDGALEWPADCAGNKGKCKGRNFAVVPNDPDVAAPSVQYAKLQEEQDASKSSSSSSSSSAQGGAAAAAAGAGAAGGGGGGTGGAGGGAFAAFYQNLAKNSDGGAPAGAPTGGGDGTKRQLVEISLVGTLKDTVSPGDNIAIAGILSKRKQDGASKETRGTLVMTCQVLGLRVLKMSGNAISVNHQINALAKQRLLQQRGATGNPAADGALLNSAVNSPLNFLGGNSSWVDSQNMLGGDSQFYGPEHNTLAGTGRQAVHLGVNRLPPSERVDLLPMLVQRFCPQIYGHIRTKAALLLALAGGTEKPWPEAPRSQIHVLMLGDAGIGKSQLLRACLQASRRGVFVTANSSSAVGLTVSMSRSGDGTVCEAGAVLHGDGGVTCIDEIDKGGNEQKALLEVMEQQTVSVAKAGLVFSMPVRTSIISAGNPVAGRFDPNKSYAENVGLGSALVSRFDFVMLLADQDGALGGQHVVTPSMARGPLGSIYRPALERALDGKGLLHNRFMFNNPNRAGLAGNSGNNQGGANWEDAEDQYFLQLMMGGGGAQQQQQHAHGGFGGENSVAEHVLMSHRAGAARGGRGGFQPPGQRNPRPQQQQQFGNDGADSDGFATPDAPHGGGGGPRLGPSRTNERLKDLYGYDDIDGMSETQQLLLSMDVRTAIELARARTPLISQKGQAVLLEAYVTERRRYFAEGTVDSAEVTPRYLQSLIRVTEARAKLAMEDPATEAHARFAVELLQSTRSVSSLTGAGRAVGTANRIGRQMGAPAPARRGKGNEQERALAAVQDKAERDGREGKYLKRSAIEAVLRDIGVRNPEAMFERMNSVGKLVQRGSELGYEVMFT